MGPVGEYLHCVDDVDFRAKKHLAHRLTKNRPRSASVPSLHSHTGRTIYHIRAPDTLYIFM